MLKKTIKYVDYDDVAREEDFYFHISQAEAGEMQFSTPGGLNAHINRITQTQNTPEIHKLFKEIILNSYGEKSPDGKRFMKKDDQGRSLGELFAQTEAYSVLYMELITDADTMAAFINGVASSINGIAESVNNRQTVIPANFS